MHGLRVLEVSFLGIRVLGLVSARLKLCSASLTLVSGLGSWNFRPWVLRGLTHFNAVFVFVGLMRFSGCSPLQLLETLSIMEGCAGRRPPPL